MKCENQALGGLQRYQPYFKWLKNWSRKRPKLLQIWPLLRNNAVSDFISLSSNHHIHWTYTIMLKEGHTRWNSFEKKPFSLEPVLSCS